MIETKTAIKLRDVRKVFRTRSGEMTAVKDVTLSIDAGSVVALLGPNGAGKTTTIDMILGLTSPTAGDITVLGKSPRAATVSGKVSAVLQSGGLLRDPTVGETVEMIASTFPDPITGREAGRRAGRARVRTSKDSQGTRAH